MSHFKVGDKAPLIKCQATGNVEIDLADFTGKQNVVMIFYVAAFTPVCASELLNIELNIDKFKQLSTTVIGISCDTIWANQMFSASLGGLSFPLIGDHKRSITETFGLLREDGYAQRATIIIDKKGVIRYLQIHEIDKPRDLGLIIQELEKIEKE